MAFALAADSTLPRGRVKKLPERTAIFRPPPRQVFAGQDPGRVIEKMVCFTGPNARPYCKGRRSQRDPFRNSRRYPDLQGEIHGICR